MHKNIPNWYKTKIFNNKKMLLVTFDAKTHVKMTNALFSKNKFEELYQLVKYQIENEKPIIIKETKKPISNKRKEREKWLRHITCPNCGENTNIHKKDKRKRKTGYTIQRFYCNKCNSMFQVDFDELEKLIQEYHEKNKIL